MAAELGQSCAGLKLSASRRTAAFSLPEAARIYSEDGIPQIHSPTTGLGTGSIGVYAPRMPRIRPENADKAAQSRPQIAEENQILPQASVNHSRPSNAGPCLAGHWPLSSERPQNAEHMSNGESPGPKMLAQIVTEMHSHG